MMRDTRIRIDDTGQIEVVDPGFDCLELLRAIDPGFQIRHRALPGFEYPRFLQTRGMRCGIERRELIRISEGRLWDIHADIVNQMHAGAAPSIQSKAEASLLDLKIELCRHMLSSCRLCARRCGVDRVRGELGICLLGTEAIVADQFIHIAEEPPINPSLLINLSGCGLRCRFCQQWEPFDPASVGGKKLEVPLWGELSTEGARSISFIGGSPDESLYAILQFLASAPHDWRLPVVWNCHAYETPETIQLLDGIVDVYVPDFKYGNEYCGLQLSDVSNYPMVAKAAINAMIAQEVPVIVRILVLPEHFDCCHAPALDFLGSLSSEMLFVSVRGQYCPEWRITTRDGQMARRPYPEEVESVRRRALSLGLKLT